MAQKINYNLELLTKFCSDNSITLLKDYSGEVVNRETRIEGKCLTRGCENNFDKTFRNLYKINGYCKECTLEIGKKNKIITNNKKFGYDYPAQSKVIKNKTTETIDKNKTENPMYHQEIISKMKQTCLEKYGKEHPMYIQDFKDKQKVTCFKNHGVEYSMQSKEVKKKCIDTWIAKHGVAHISQSEDIKLKKINTCKENYGCENPLQNEKIRKKIRETCIETYGCENPSQSEDIKLKKINTCKENYGCEHPLQNEEIMKKVKETCITTYGYEHPLQNEEIIKKLQKTCLEKYGAKSPQQNAEIAEKTLKSSFSRKEYTLPSGKVINIQGYEPYAIDELIETINEDEIKTGASNVPEIWYIDEEGKKHRYYVDIYLPSKNICIEVKSTWTYKMKNVLIKQKAVKDAGYDCQIWVYDKKGEKVECIL